MSTELNKATVLQFYKAFDDRDLDRAVALLDDNVVAHLAGVPKPLNKEEFTQFGRSFYLAFSQGHHQFDQAIAAEDKVVTCGTFTGIHSGPFQGLPSTGKSISLSIMHIDQVENGKITQHWGQGDALGLMQQLGIVFLPGPTLLPSLVRQIGSRLLRRR
jgi:steroid delta-isomerase-like uncharacterized protein